MNLLVGEQNVCMDVLAKSGLSLGNLCVGSLPQCDLAQKGEVIVNISK